jgi:hypothetical protein
MSKKKRKNNQHALQTGTNLYGVLQVQRWWALPLRRLLLCFQVILINPYWQQRKIWWHHHNSKTITGYTCWVKNSGLLQMFSTVVWMMSSLYQDIRWSHFTFSILVIIIKLWRFCTCMVVPCTVQEVKNCFNKVLKHCLYLQTYHHIRSSCSVIGVVKQSSHHFRDLVC